MYQQCHVTEGSVRIVPTAFAVFAASLVQRYIVEISEGGEEASKEGEIPMRAFPPQGNVKCHFQSLCLKR